jgi:hypothetical protein
MTDMIQALVKVVTANTEQGRTLLELCTTIIQRMDVMEDSISVLQNALAEQLAQQSQINDDLATQVSNARYDIDVLKAAQSESDGDRIQ